MLGWHQHSASCWPPSCCWWGHKGQWPCSQGIKHTVQDWQLTKVPWAFTRSPVFQHCLQNFPYFGKTETQQKCVIHQKWYTRSSDKDGHFKEELRRAVHMQASVHRCIHDVPDASQPSTYILLLQAGSSPCLESVSSSQTGNYCKMWRAAVC